MTAWRIALSRAAHQIYDRDRVFDDPFALRIVGEEGLRVLRELEDHYKSGNSRRLRSPIVARSRYVDDAIRTATAKRISQVVILGAGLDTLAYRTEFPAAVALFEVDHPATQQWKRYLLAEANIAVPTALRFVAVDLNVQSLTEVLETAGVDLARPFFVSWLGVIYYLEPSAARRTLAMLGSLGPGSEVVFDYIAAPWSVAPEDRKTWRGWPIA